MTLPNKKRFAEWLKKARLEKGYTQDKLGEQIGTEKAHVSKMETEKLVPSLEMLQKLITQLEVPFSEPLIELGYLKETDRNSLGGMAARYEQLTPEYKAIADDLVQVLLKRSKLQSQDQGALKSPGTVENKPRVKKKPTAA